MKMIKRVATCLLMAYAGAAWAATGNQGAQDSGEAGVYTVSVSPGAQHNGLSFGVLAQGQKSPENIREENREKTTNDRARGLGTHLLGWDVEDIVIQISPPSFLHQFPPDIQFGQTVSHNVDPVNASSEWFSDRDEVGELYLKEYDDTLLNIHYTAGEVVGTVIVKAFASRETSPAPNVTNPPGSPIRPKVIQPVDLGQASARDKTVSSSFSLKTEGGVKSGGLSYE